MGSRGHGVRGPRPNTVHRVPNSIAVGACIDGGCGMTGHLVGVLEFDHSAAE